jgi:hypothetical protein
LFLIAMATLVFEIALSRLLSVVTWYHLSFFAISVAMLGMTAGAITVFVRDRAFSGERLLPGISSMVAWFAASIPLAVLSVCYLPITSDLVRDQGLRTVVNMIVITVAAALPFYFSGVAISALLSRYPLPVNRLYAADLIGAAVGCLLVLLGLGLFDGPSVALMSGLLALLAGWRLSAVTGGAGRPWLVVFVLALVVVGYCAATQAIRPQMVKDHAAGNDPEVDRWNSFSRVIMGPENSGPAPIWRGDREALKDVQVRQRWMTIDGLAGTIMRAYETPADLDHLKYDITNIAYYLRPSGGAAIIGVGGGKDVQSALAFGHEQVLGVEVNPIFIDLLEGPYAGFAGIGDNDKVRLVVDDARSYFSHSQEQFEILQMSLIDTWASTGAGAFSLSENGLYTIEAWTTFMSRLSARGLFTVSRWYSDKNLGETGRALSLAVATLLELGAENPADHIALVVNNKVATLVVSRQPLSAEDITILQRACRQYKHELVISPGQPLQNEMLRRVLASRSVQELQEVSDDNILNISPPTDNSPYFFNMLKLQNIVQGLDYKTQARGVVRGNLTATMTLAALIGVLILLTLLGVLVPLLIHRHRYAGEEKLEPAAMLFFALIGAGFMSLEIGLLQRLSVFLGHPVYALGILLFSIILSTGIGSYFSDRLGLQSAARGPKLALLTAILILTVQALLELKLSTMITYTMSLKILISIALIAPIGFCLGCFFPTGMSLVREDSHYAAPWYWGLNGIFGVLASALAVFISIYLSISVNFYIAALCYALTGLCLRRMLVVHQSSAT